MYKKILCSVGGLNVFCLSDVVKGQVLELSCQIFQEVLDRDLMGGR